MGSLKKYVIFGVGGSGRAVYRYLFKKKLTNIVFVDNSVAQQGKYFNEIMIHSPNELVGMTFEKIVLSGAYIDEVYNQLVNILDIPKCKIEIIDKKKLSYQTPNRERATNHALKILLKIFKEGGIDYFLAGSSLLCLIRGQNLSEASDVDFFIMSNKSARYLIEKINLFEDEGMIVDINKVALRSDSFEYEGYNINIKTICDTKIEEHVDIDITVTQKNSDMYVTPLYGNFLYVPEFFYEDYSLIKYKNLSLRVPQNYKGYLETIYGKTWRYPAVSWSNNDYKNAR